MKIAILVPRIDKSGPVRGGLAAASYLRKTEDLKVISINDQSFDVDGIQCTPLGGLSYFRKIQSLKNCKKMAIIL